jgi:hypothetical protein
MPTSSIDSMLSRKDSHRSPKSPKWFVKTDVGFEPYSKYDCGVLEAAYSQNWWSPVQVVCGLYEVNLVTMKQRNVETNFLRDVKRSTAGFELRKVNLSGDFSTNNIMATIAKCGIPEAPFRDFLEKQSLSNIKIVGVQLFDNQPLNHRFRLEKQRMADAGRPEREVWVFHGTALAEAIMVEGFKVGGIDDHPVVNGSKHGFGVYTGKSPKDPIAYSRHGSSRQLILACALPGLRGTAWDDGDCDSWEPSSDWLVFRRGEQLLPKAVITFDDTPAPGPAAASAHPSASAARAPRAAPRAAPQPHPGLPGPARGPAPPASKAAPLLAGPGQQAWRAPSHGGPPLTAPVPQPDWGDINLSRAPL